MSDLRISKTGMCIIAHQGKKMKSHCGKVIREGYVELPSLDDQTDPLCAHCYAVILAKRCASQQRIIERLRSPWVSVGERLPEDESAEYQVALIGAELKPLCVLDNIEWRDGLFRYGESKSNTFATYAHGHTPSEAVVYAWRIHQPDTPPPAPSEV